MATEEAFIEVQFYEGQQELSLDCNRAVFEQIRDAVLSAAHPLYLSEDPPNEFHRISINNMKPAGVVKQPRSV